MDNLPLGAEHHPSAPWNNESEPIIQEQNSNIENLMRSLEAVSTQSAQILAVMEQLENDYLKEKMKMLCRNIKEVDKAAWELIEEVEGLRSE